MSIKPYVSLYVNGSYMGIVDQWTFQRNAVPDPEPGGDPSKLSYVPDAETRLCILLKENVDE